jgi:hypothetical protein
MNLTLILLAVGGLLLHFLGRYGEYWRSTAKVGPWAYIVQDPPGWLSAIVGTAICMLLLQDLPTLLGIPPEFSGGSLLRIAAVTSGYMGSSLAAKVPALFTGRGTR